MTAQTDTQGSVTTVYKVSGMSCGHCEGSVSGEISQLPGVTSVKAVASTGEVTVVSAAPSTTRPSARRSTRRASSSSARSDTADRAKPAAVPAERPARHFRFSTGPCRPADTGSARSGPMSGVRT